MDYRFIKNDLACPVCKSAELDFGADKVLCRTCHRFYPLENCDNQLIINFIPDFDSPYLNPAYRFWKYLFNKSSLEIERLLQDKNLFNAADEEYSHYRIDGRKVLDIGGNSGELRRYLNKAQLYVCLEPDIKAYGRRALLGKIDTKLQEPFIFIHGVAEYLPFKASSFDSVVLRGVIEHVWDINFVFFEAYRVLKTKGKLFVSSDFHGEESRSQRKNIFQKIIDFWKKYGLLKTINRIFDRLMFNLKRKINPWKDIVDFSQPQLESGHIYDNLQEDDIKRLATAAGFRLSESFSVGRANIFIFKKP
jgi:ubiquinone/menaquinone biosynthesis C-methylase UbiE